jgi:hypothetical protein
MTEGGIPVVMAYSLLFAMTWWEIVRIRRLIHLDPDLLYMAESMRVIFIVFIFFSFFADLWLSPVMYTMVGLAYNARRCLDEKARQVSMPIRTRVGAAPAVIG